MVGVNFVGNSTAPASNYNFSATDTAGIVSQENWNNAKTGSGSTANIVGPLNGALVDDSGSDSLVTISWSADGTGRANRTEAAGDNVLMNGQLTDQNGGGDASVTLGNLNQFASEGYQVYFGAGTDNRTGTISDGATTFYTRTASSSGKSFPADYTQATSTTPGSYSSANYAVFSGTADDLTLTYQRGSGNAGIHGIQIVAIPEPSTLGFVTAAGGCLLGIRRLRLN